jgi:hypothetical protein
VRTAAPAYAHLARVQGSQAVVRAQQQRAVVADAHSLAGDRAARNHRIDLRAAQRVERIESRQERCEALGVKRRERIRQRRQQCRRDRLARWRAVSDLRLQISPGLVDHGRGVGRHADVEADADHRARHTSLQPAFDQDAAELLQHAVRIVDDQVVRPFHADPCSTERTQRFRDGDADDQAEPAEACDISVERAGQRQIQVRARWRRPGAPLASATAVLAVGEQRDEAMFGRAPAQQFAVGRIDGVHDLDRRERAARRIVQSREDRSRVERVDVAHLRRNHRCSSRALSKRDSVPARSRARLARCV